jgi:hypothetical protein
MTDTTVTGRFFDVLNSWHQLLPYISHPETQRALEIYHWRRYQSNVDNSMALVSFVDDARTSPDVAYVKETIQQLIDDGIDPKLTPYWYCMPHECLDLNSLIMGTLASLSLGKEVYILVVVPFGVTVLEQRRSLHIVVSDRKCNRDDTIEIRSADTNADADANAGTDIVIYDLIYPLMEFYPNSWDARDGPPLDKLRVVSCISMSGSNIQMGYINYPPTE